ncbi:MAG: class I SAM-dependent methyltransferase [Xenococcus sp. (in: cyanobacteria)]
MEILDYYVKTAPSIQNALNIFKDEWASLLPTGYRESYITGNTPLFEDSRIHWAVNQMGGVEGKKVLELGPLEAGHTYMIEKMGAASITSVEANTRAYLKCLIIKEALKLEKVSFLCGDMVEYLKKTSDTFDSCIACGVLYHMSNPLELLSLIVKKSHQVFVWTHYYDSNIIRNNSVLTKKFPNSLPTEYQGFRCKLYRQEYQNALDFGGFCGGSNTFSHWLSREDLLSSLEHFGFSNININFDEPNHPNGPCLGLVAMSK